LPTPEEAAVDSKGASYSLLPLRQGNNAAVHEFQPRSMIGQSGPDCRALRTTVWNRRAAWWWVFAPGRTTAADP